METLANTPRDLVEHYTDRASKAISSGNSAEVFQAMTELEMAIQAVMPPQQRATLQAAAESCAQWLGEHGQLGGEGE